MKRKYVLTAIVLVAAVLLFLWLQPNNGGANDMGTSAPASAPASDGRLSVDAVVLKPETLRNLIRLTGTAIANSEVELRSETSGLITGLFLREGASVQKGELLVKINDADLLAQRRQYEIELKLAEDTERRQKQLQERGAISLEDYDLALNRLNVVKAQISLVDAQIAKTEVKAPFSGTVGLRYVDMGDYLTPTTRISVLQQIDSVKVDFSVPEQYASLVHIGDRIHFRIAGSARDYEGRIFAVEPRIDATSRSLPIRAVAPNRDKSILPGAFVEIEYVLDEVDDAVLIPTQSLVPQLQGQIVYVYRNGHAEAVDVRTGIRNNTQIEVVEGLAHGDTVVTTGILQMRQGLPLRLSSVQ